MIKRVFSHCTMHIKRRLYEQLIRSKVEYCNTVWSPWQCGLQQKLEKVQKNAAKFILGKAMGNYDMYLNGLNWLPLHIRKCFQRCVMVYKILNKHVEICFDEHFNMRHVRELRQCNSMQLFAPRFSTETHGNSFFVKVVREWNSLPDSIVNLPSLELFKKELLAFYLSKPHATIDCNLCRNV